MADTATSDVMRWADVPEGSHVRIVLMDGRIGAPKYRKHEGRLQYQTGDSWKRANTDPSGRGFVESA